MFTCRKRERGLGMAESILWERERERKIRKKERAQIEREKEQARTDRATRMHMLTVTETSEK